MYSLTRYATEETAVLQRVAWSMRLTVASSDPAYPPEVFVFQIEDPENLDSRAWFTAVASPAQLLEYPVGAPAAPTSSGGLYQPYFRTAELTLVSRNAADLERVYAQVAEEITLLRLNLEAEENLEETDTIEL